MDGTQYDNENGQGKAAEVVAALRREIAAKKNAERKAERAKRHRLAAYIMARHACETIAQTSGKEKARKCLLETVKLALDAPDEEIETQARARGVVTQQ